jgi:hypothetical protein
VFSNLLPGNDTFVAIRCSENVISEPLLSNGRPLWLHYSGFYAVFTELLLSNGLFRHNTLNIGHNNALTLTDSTLDRRLLVLMRAKLASMPSFNMDVAGLSLYHEGIKKETQQTQRSALSSGHEYGGEKSNNWLSIPS